MAVDKSLRTNPESSLRVVSHLLCKYEWWHPAKVKFGTKASYGDISKTRRVVTVLFFKLLMENYSDRDTSDPQSCHEGPKSKVRGPHRHLTNELLRGQLGREGMSCPLN